MYRQGPRVPISCPPGFKGRYTVSPGDTMFMLSQMFRTRLEALAANNPHITNPNVLIPGDVLCVPGLIPIPCCVTLNKQGRVPFGTGGVAFANFGPRGGQVVNVLATLPPPSFFGNYDLYIATAFFRDIGGFGNQLFPTREDPPTWATRIELPTVVSLAPDVRVVVQPSNSVSGVSGPVILQGNLGTCGATNPPLPEGICGVLLTGTGGTAASTGFANVRFEPAQATIVGINLPEPTTFGSQFTRYRAWIIDAQTQNRFRVEMQRIQSNLWVGQAAGGSLRNFDEIIVTAEPVPGTSSPTGPTVLRGSLVSCTAV
ncbi:MAG: LysM peptidoglycan-binding domain-containing protein [Clostridia bacterium]|nr:LysM peptidoglycan-binding domain-containing protein [Clostridia bacterium]